MAGSPAGAGVDIGGASKAWGGRLSRSKSEAVRGPRGVGSCITISRIGEKLSWKGGEGFAEKLGGFIFPMGLSP